ncbi:MAG TPA: FkbM family methyltransferase [Pyrinomonadaceae bacterium]|nr:FkbM family methyltransferase [Pyrinomonadaceae bacterium]
MITAGSKQRAISLEQTQIATTEFVPSPEEELDALLGESPQAAKRRMDRVGQATIKGNESFVLYGAGQFGRTVLARLRTVGVEPVAFADDTRQKQGQVIDGLPVLQAREISERFGAGTVFVVTILNPKLNFVTARRRLSEFTQRPVISFLDLAWRYPQTFLPYYQFDEPAEVLKKADDIRNAFQLFAEDESRRQFLAHLKFRLRLDYEALPPATADNAFPRDLLPRLPADTTFVDCGAYDGDSIRAFLTYQSNEFRSIYAFEPDEGNCNRLRAYVNTLGEEAAGRIHIFNAGVGARRETLRFCAAGNMSSSFDASGELEVNVLPLDEVIPFDDSQLYLKFDVEGAEWEALKGCAQLLEGRRPLVALSAYHRPDDLWQLPLCLNRLNLDYAFFLRTHGEDGMDLVLYALPANDLS